MTQEYQDFITEVALNWKEAINTTVPMHDTLMITDVSDDEIINALEDATDHLSPELIRYMSGEFVRVLLLGLRMGYTMEGILHNHMEAFIDTDSFERLQILYKGKDKKELH